MQYQLVNTGVDLPSVSKPPQRSPLLDSSGKVKLSLLRYDREAFFNNETQSVKREASLRNEYSRLSENTAKYNKLCPLIAGAPNATTLPDDKDIY